MPPPNGSPYLVVGNDVTIAEGQRLLGTDGAGGNTGQLIYGNSFSGESEPDPIHDADAIETYRDIRPDLGDASDCYGFVEGERRETTGEVDMDDWEVRFIGDSESMLQVFAVDGDILDESSQDANVVFNNIPEGATVLVNVYGDDRVVRTSGGVGGEPPWNELRHHLLWNFPETQELSLTGTSQFEGSILVGQADSMTTVSTPGVNGRFFTAGSVTHAGTAGTEFHSYPFDGDLPDCDEEPDPTTPTDGPTDDPTKTSPIDHKGSDGDAAKDWKDASNGFLPVTGTSLTFAVIAGVAAAGAGVSLLLAARRRAREE